MMASWIDGLRCLLGQRCISRGVTGSDGYDRLTLYGRSSAFDIEGWPLRVC